jgi:rhodanese-related sulfurtransferase
VIGRFLKRTPAIDARGAADLIAARQALVLDVRHPSEWRSGHIREAVHIPLTHLSSRLHQLPQGTPVVTVCRSGHRSAVAARMLARAGYDVRNLNGGMNAWLRAGLPVQ